MSAHLAGVDLAIIIGFLVIVTIVGYVLSKAASGGLEDYFLGGGKIPWWVLGISTSTSNFDMAGTMIIVAVVFGLGLSGFLVEIRGGVGLSLAFLMIFLGKWLRRSRVMTSAEWMKLRFGTDKQGRAAHLFSAIAYIALSLGMIIYFSKGAGAFLTHFLPFSEFTCTAAMVLIGLFYTLMSGLYGVVFTDVIQMILLTFTALYVSVKAFAMRATVTFPDNFFNLSLDPPAGLGAGLIKQDAGSWEPILQFFGLCVMMWIARTFMEGMGGVGGYTDQRFFAARNEREASLLTLEAIILSAMRWTMVAGLVVMGYALLQEGGAGADSINENAENVLPVVLSQLLPTGVKGIVVAGLIAAAMSTFDSTLNAGASYIVKDVYQSYINPDADGKQLMSVSRWATAGLCVAGVGLAAVVSNINEIWSLITMGLGAGLFVPLFLRWYWPRFNGYGFAAGAGAAVLAGPVYGRFIEMPLYYSFPATLGTVFSACVIATFLTPKTDDEILARFCAQVNPWGMWTRIRKLAVELGHLEEKERGERFWERVNDGIAVCFAVVFQFTLLIASMSFIFHDWVKFWGFGIAAVIAAVGLYFFWYRNLKGADECDEDDERWGRYFVPDAPADAGPSTSASPGSDEELDTPEEDEAEAQTD
jgi:Na+/proline symporter